MDIQSSEILVYDSSMFCFYNLLGTRTETTWLVEIPFPFFRCIGFISVYVQLYNCVPCTSFPPTVGLRGAGFQRSRNSVLDVVINA